MLEKYDMPVKFTEEERKAYAAWGIKKRKTMAPYVVIVLLIDILSIALGCIQVWSIRNTDSILFHIILDSGWMASACYVLAVCLTIVIVGPLNWVLDRIWKKPEEPRWLQITLTEQGILVNLLSGTERGEILSSERHSWTEAESVLDPGNNSVLVQNCWVQIGENTIENIYPEGYRHPWMDCPNRKVKGIDSVKKLWGILKGYQASLAEQKMEQEWQEMKGGAS